METKKPVEGRESSQRTRNRCQTEFSLKAALAELISTKKRISISAVAAIAGVSAPLIHNKYPSIAEAIRQSAGKDAKSLRKEALSELTEALDSIRALRAENRNLEEDLRKLASINEALQRQLVEAKAISRAKNVFNLSERLKDKR